MWKCEACSPKYTEGCNAKFLRVVYQSFFLLHWVILLEEIITFIAAIGEFSNNRRGQSAFSSCW